MSRYDYDELFDKSQKILKSNKLGEAGIRNYEDLKKALIVLQKALEAYPGRIDED